MKRLLAILVIIFIVASLHFLILKFIFSNSNSENPQNTNPTSPPAPQEITPENEIKPVKPEPKRLILDYSNCIYDKIPEIPESSKPKTAILVDLDTGKVLFAKAPKKAAPIASMTKMMTALLAFEKLEKDPNISLDTPIQVTKSASQVGGSQLYLDVRETFTLGELLKAIMIMSANDATQLIAEFLSDGNSLDFIDRMNEKAKKLKMPMTKFFNPHGLPGPSPAEDNVSSAEGMAILAYELLKYPKAIEWASIKIDYLPRKNLKNPDEPKEPSLLKNHNNLIGVCPGVNGLKTGFTQRAGFCLTATCERNGRKMVAVVTGMQTKKERDTLVAKLFDWGYNQIKKQNIVSMENSDFPLSEQDLANITIPK